MAIGAIQNEGDLRRWHDRQHPPGTNPAITVLPELAADPAAPTSGVVFYCIANNGAGKRALRARFATGAVQTVATEP